MLFKVFIIVYICVPLMRANATKRILYVCDRRNVRHFQSGVGWFCSVLLLN